MSTLQLKTNALGKPGTASEAIRVLDVYRSERCDPVRTMEYLNLCTEGKVHDNPRVETNQNTVPSGSKPRYEILDGLRGVAAIIVVAFHLCEVHSKSPLTKLVNHGYLAVDFFYVLSGFVIGYAYDDRWNRISPWDFLKSRIARLHPMVIMGTIIGAACFYFSVSQTPWSVAVAPGWKLLLAALVGFAMIPAVSFLDIRGNNEMFPLNGPAWSLFYEYIANILYALVIRRSSKKVLAVLVVMAGFTLVAYSVVSHGGSVAGGFAFNASHIRLSFIRLIYPFFAGLLLFRLGKLIHLKHSFWICSALVLVALAMPRIGGKEHFWMNGLYESLCIILLFPLIVSIGAGETLKDTRSAQLCGFLGGISYPIYITHYPLVYIYNNWVRSHGLSMQSAFPFAMAVMAGSILIAHACLKLYDEPARSWLKAHLKKSDSDHHPQVVAARSNLDQLEAERSP